MRGQTLAARSFWWDRTTDVDVDPLRAVVFDLDGAVADLDEDGELAPRSGLIDLVMSLFVAGVWVGVVSSGRRSEVEPLVRDLLGDGLIETIVTSDDTESPDTSALYELALWEFGIDPESALAVVGTSAGLRAAADAGLASVVLSTDEVAGAVAVRSGYDGFDPLLVGGCRRMHRHWWASRKLAAA